MEVPEREYSWRAKCDNWDSFAIISMQMYLQENNERRLEDTCVPKRILLYLATDTNILFAHFLLFLCFFYIVMYDEKKSIILCPHKLTKNRWPKDTALFKKFKVSVGSKAASDGAVQSLSPIPCSYLSSSPMTPSLPPYLPFSLPLHLSSFLPFVV